MIGHSESILKEVITDSPVGSTVPSPSGFVTVEYFLLSNLILLWITKPPIQIENQILILSLNAFYNFRDQFSKL